jgi:hypothetical protein
MFGSGTYERGVSPVGRRLSGSNSLHPSRGTALRRLVWTLFSREIRFLHCGIALAPLSKRGTLSDLNIGGWTSFRRVPQNEGMEIIRVVGREILDSRGNATSRPM